MVPLIDALDEELGVGFGSAASEPDASPLLRGLRLQDAGVIESKTILKVHPALFRQIVECIRSGKTELELEFSRLETGKSATPKLADAFCLTGALVAKSAAAVRQGDFEFTSKAASVRVAHGCWDAFAMKTRRSKRCSNASAAGRGPRS